MVRGIRQFVVTPRMRSIGLLRRTACNEDHSYVARPCARGSRKAISEGPLATHGGRL